MIRVMSCKANGCYSALHGGTSLWCYRCYRAQCSACSTPISFLMLLICSELGELVLRGRSDVEGVVEMAAARLGASRGAGLKSEDCELEKSADTSERWKHVVHVEHEFDKVNTSDDCSGEEGRRGRVVADRHKF